MINFLKIFNIQTELSKKIISNNKKKNFFFFLNPHSFYVSRMDKSFFNAISKSNHVFIDGIGIYFFVVLKNIFSSKNIKRITGFDFFQFFLNNSYNKKIFFLGSSKKNLNKIKQNILLENPTCKVFTYSPSFKEEFTNKDLIKFAKKINRADPDILFLGLGAPKQEKIAIRISEKTKVKNIAPIGAVFDYYANNPTFIFFLMRFFWLEWLYRLFVTPRVWKRIVASFPVFLFMIFFEYILNIKNYFYTLKISKNINNVVKKKNFIISAFNLAYYSFLFFEKIKPTKNTFLWPDGVFSKFFNIRIEKLPGRRLISELIIPSNIKVIHLIGNTTKNIENFLHSKFKKQKIKFSPLPFGNIDQIIKSLPKVNKNELVLVTMPTPKQEIIAAEIDKRNKNAKIICIGGGLGIAAHDEEPCPKFIEKIYLESIWRLRYQTLRRLNRLIQSITITFVSLPCLFFKRIKLIDE